MNANGTRILRPNSIKTLGLLAVCAIFAAGGLWIVAQGAAIGWLVVIFFGLGVLVSAVRLLPSSAYLRIDSQGFTLCSLFRTYSFRWDDVQGFVVAWNGQFRLVAFNFAPGYQRASIGNKISAGISGFDAALPNSYGMSLADLAALLNDYKQRYGTKDLAQN
jgi:hypothetical protein